MIRRVVWRGARCASLPRKRVRRSLQAQEAFAREQSSMNKSIPACSDSQCDATDKNLTLHNFFRQPVQRTDPLHKEAAEVRPFFTNQAKELDELLARIYPLIQQYILDNGKLDNQANSTPVVRFRSPQDLKQLLDLSLNQQGETVERIASYVDDLLQYSTRTGHPRFFDKLFAGTDPIGQVSEFLSALLNNNAHTYATAPVASLMEEQVLAAISERVFDKPSEQAESGQVSEGLLVPGGTFSNLTAVVVARHHFFPHVKEEGYRPGEVPAMFVSAQAHYSMARAAVVCGLGKRNCIPVQADKQGRMRPEALDLALNQAREEGKTPFLVAATAGTTVMGGFDPIQDIAQVCEEHSLTSQRKPWLHVDGSWGGVAIFSKKHRHLVKGIERADSFVLNPHKGLGLPQQCSALVLAHQHAGLLEWANSSNAEYLFHQHAHKSLDLGDRSLQCGRKTDAIKLWLSWKYLGWKALARRVDRNFQAAKLFAVKVEGAGNRTPGLFELVVQPESCNVCFWHIPLSLRRAYEQKHSVNTSSSSLLECPRSFQQLVGLATQRIYRIMQVKGSLLLNFNPLPDHELPHFFRLTLVQGERVEDRDLDFILEEVERAGRELDVNAMIAECRLSFVVVSWYLMRARPASQVPQQHTDTLLLTQGKFLRGPGSTVCICVNRGRRMQKKSHASKLRNKTGKRQKHFELTARKQQKQNRKEFRKVHGTRQALL
eukprot:g74687.t1